MMDKQTQKDILLDYMKQNGSVTRAEAWFFLNIANMTARMSELIRDGHPITKKTVWKKNKSGKMTHYTVYSLEGV